MKRIAYMLVLFLLIGCGGGGGGGSAGNSTSLNSVSSAIGNQGGQLITPDGFASITIPQGALDNTTTITIGENTESLPPGGLSSAYEFKPDGLTFKTPVTIRLKYDPEVIPSNIPETDLKIGYYLNGSLQIVDTSSVDTVNKFITATISHYSTYTVAINALPFGNLLGSFNGVSVYSNGDPSNQSNRYNTDIGGYNAGMEWQCVEYVNRYYKVICNLEIRIPGDNANVYFKNASARGLLSFQNNGSEPPMVGDIIVSEGGNNGHVAIVREVMSNKIIVAQQNYLNNNGDLQFPLARNGNNIGSFGGGKTYPVKGWVRAPFASIYVSSGKGTTSGPSYLFSIVPTASGSDTSVGLISTSDGFQPVISDLALTPSGILYGVSFDTLYVIDKATARATKVGSLGVSNVNALASDSNGNLFGATLEGYLFRINNSTGATSGIGTFGYFSSGDLCFSTNGKLYAAVYDPVNQKYSILVELNKNTGSATRINTGIDTGVDYLFGLSYVNGQLYGVSAGSPGSLWNINISNGQTSFIRNLSFSAFGSS